MLQKKFEDFKRDVSASTERYTGVNNLARRLVAEGHSDTVFIKEKQDDMRFVLRCSLYAHTCTYSIAELLFWFTWYTNVTVVKNCSHCKCLL